MSAGVTAGCVGLPFRKTVGDDLKDEADMKTVITTVSCMVCAEHQPRPTCLIISQRHGAASCECQAAARLPRSVQTAPRGFDSATCSEPIKPRLSLCICPWRGSLSSAKSPGSAVLGSVLPAATQFLALTAGLLEIN